MSLSSNNIENFIFEQLIHKDFNQLLLDKQTLAILMSFDGEKSLRKISKKTGIKISIVKSTTSALVKLGLAKRVTPLLPAKKRQGWNPLKHIKFKWKVYALLAIFSLFSVAAAYSYHKLFLNIQELAINHSKTTMITSYKDKIKSLTNVMALSLDSMTENISSEEERYKAYSQAIKNTRFFSDNSGYYFIYKLGGEVFVHAGQPGLEGKSLINRQHTDGKFLIRELEKVAILGGGYVEYLTRRPGEENKHAPPIPKISYTRMIPGTSYWIGTGVYIEDIEQKKNELLSDILLTSKDFYKKLYLIALGVILLIILPLTFYLVRSIVAPMERLTHIANSFSEGNTDIEIPYLDYSDEIGVLANSMNRLGKSVKIAMSKLQFK